MSNLKKIELNSIVLISGYSEEFRIIGRPYDTERDVQCYECIQLGQLKNGEERLKITAPADKVTIVKEFVKKENEDDVSTEGLFDDEEISDDEETDISEGLESDEGASTDGLFD